jgi:hypothetical protein
VLHHAPHGILCPNIGQQHVSFTTGAGDPRSVVRGRIRVNVYDQDSRTFLSQSPRGRAANALRAASHDCYSASHALHVHIDNSAWGSRSAQNAGRAYQPLSPTTRLLLLHAGVLVEPENADLPGALLRQQATVHDDRVSGLVAGVVSGEECHRRRDLLGLADATERNASGERLGPPFEES